MIGILNERNMRVIEFQALNFMESNFIKKYDRHNINKLINNSNLKLNRYELEYFLLFISKKLSIKKEVSHEQTRLF